MEASTPRLEKLEAKLTKAKAKRRTAKVKRNIDVADTKRKSKTQHVGDWIQMWQMGPNENIPYTAKSLVKAHEKRLRFNEQYNDYNVNLRKIKAQRLKDKISKEKKQIQEDVKERKKRDNWHRHLKEQGMTTITGKRKREDEDKGSRKKKKG